MTRLSPIPFSLLVFAVACAPPGDEAAAPDTEAAEQALPDAERASGELDEGFDRPAVLRFLRDYAEQNGAVGDMPTRVALAAIPGSDLVAAYLMGPFWCGTGGCNLLVLRPAEGEETYAIIGEISIVQTPVRALSTRNNGLPDLGVQVSGGGVEEGYEALLAFDGLAYPENPSAPPARPIERAQGTVIIAEEDRGEPLFQ